MMSQTTTATTADRVPAGCVVNLGQGCLAAAIARNPSMATRLGELGIRPGAELVLGPKVAGGARVVSVSGCRYAIDCATLRCIEVNL